MRIKFPFVIRQTGPKEVEIETDIEGQPLVQLVIHPTVANQIPDDVLDEMYADAQTRIIRETLTVETDKAAAVSDRH